jgi:hypothetical protein
MSIGWLADVEEANEYFATARLKSAAWLALTAVSGGKDEKSAVLTQSFNRLRRCRDFSIPTSPTAAQLEDLKEAQCEVAYYIAQHGADEDSRKGRQAQGVVSAGIVKEGYSEGDLHKLPLPAIVYEILAGFMDDTPFFALEIGRDENRGITEEVTES